MNIPKCSAIDTALQITTNGGVKPCCAGAHELGSLRTAPIDVILNSDAYTSLRNSLVNDSSTPYCRKCDITESMIYSASQRTMYNNSYPSDGSRQLKQLDIRWSNLCNLTCRYCHHGDSSEWAKLKSIPIESISRDYAQGVIDLVAKNRETLKTIYLLGGEPLLQKYNEDLLDVVGPNTHIDIITNLSVRLDNNRVYQKLKQFPKILWNISIDNIGDRFEYVRHGAKWDQFLNNLEILKQDFGPRRIFFRPVYSLWSAFALQEFLAWTRSSGIEVFWQVANEDETFLPDVRGFVVYKHSEKIKKAAVDEIDRITVIDDKSKEFLSQVKANLFSTESVPGRAHQFLKWTDEIEQQIASPHKFKNLWPELNTLLLEDLS